MSCNPLTHLLGSCVIWTYVTFNEFASTINWARINIVNIVMAGAIVYSIIRKPDLLCPATTGSAHARQAGCVCVCVKGGVSRVNTDKQTLTLSL